MDDETGGASSTMGDTGSGNLGIDYFEDPSVHGKLTVKRFKEIGC
jgi:hypothetical protein